MRATWTRSIRLGAVSALTVLVVGSSAATAQAPAPPINDNYLNSLELNRIHTTLDRVDTLRDTRDTTSATVQGDIFNPPNSGGVPELTGCNGFSEAKTIWYDFYPDANGAVRIRTSGFDNIIAVMPFNTSTLQPDYSRRQCVVNQSSNVMELDPSVRAGGAYTIQVGGVNGASGMLEFLFDYIPTIVHLQADATLTAKPSSTGIQVVSLSVSAPKKSKVRVACTRGCRTQARTARNLSFSNVRGARLRSGSRLKIYVTASNSIGAYIEYQIKRGSFHKVVRCLNPGSTRPVACTS
jgi:hypothetical protein